MQNNIKLVVSLLVVGCACFLCFSNFMHKSSLQLRGRWLSVLCMVCAVDGFVQLEQSPILLTTALGFSYQSMPERLIDKVFNAIYLKKFCPCLICLPQLLVTEFLHCQRHRELSPHSCFIFCHRVETNKIEDKNRIRAEISDEVEEQREDYEQTYRKLKSEYDEALTKYKQQLKQKVVS